MTGPQPAEGAPVPRPAEPAADLPRRVTGSAPDGRDWELLVDRTGITAVTSRATVAEVHVWESDDLVTLEFWLDGADVPDPLGAQLVEQAFGHPAVRSRCPVLVCVPRRDGGLLEHVRRHVEDCSARAAGMTCLVEGRVRGDVPRRPGEGRG